MTIGVIIFLALIGVGVYVAVSSVQHIKGCTGFCNQGREECTCK